MGYLADGRCTILIIDDSSDLYREALRLLLSTMMPNAVVIEISDTKDHQLSGSVGFASLGLLKLGFPILQGLDRLRNLYSQLPATPVILISDILDDRTMLMARTYGACGFVHISASSEDLFSTIQGVLAGKAIFPGRNFESMRFVDYRLSSRQKEVLDLICKGKTNKEIGRDLNISDNTVRTHVAAIFRMLGVNSRAQASTLGRKMFFGEIA